MKRSSHPQSEPCFVAPHPALQKRMHEAVMAARESADRSIGARLTLRRQRRLGFNDGTILPPASFDLGTPLRTIRSAAAARTPLRGDINVIVVLVDFSDREMTTPNAHFEELFFSRGVLPHGSVADYFAEVSNDLVSITGKVVGPFRMPRTIAEYANGEAGTGDALPNARTMARDAALAAKPHVNFNPFDNDGNGFVDAFIVVHAGPGAEVTDDEANDIWSHKWLLDGDAPLSVNRKKIFAYLTVPEDARIGVCCHELGHLVFGWPDLYDTDETSLGIGEWCLMAGGSWNGPAVGALEGEVPAHPSAWCKKNQKWVTVSAPKTNQTNVTIDDVKQSRKILQLWKNGQTSSREHFLVESRGRTGYDRALPGEGLLVWHIDDTIETNDDENHYKVALLQADGLRDLEREANSGDAGDPYPGSSNNRTLNAKSKPSTRSYAGADSEVAITQIKFSASTAQATASIAVKKAQRTAPVSAGKRAPKLHARDVVRKKSKRASARPAHPRAR